MFGIMNLLLKIEKKKDICDGKRLVLWLFDHDRLEAMMSLAFSKFNVPNPNIHHFSPLSL